MSSSTKTNDIIHNGVQSLPWYTTMIGGIAPWIKFKTPSTSFSMTKQDLLGRNPRTVMTTFTVEAGFAAGKTLFGAICGFMVGLIGREMIKTYPKYINLKKSVINERKTELQ